jgi:hypothetical protein
MYERACARALTGLGVDVVEHSLVPKHTSLISRFELKYTMCGPTLRGLQRDLLVKVDRTHPDVVLIWLGASVLRPMHSAL